MSCDELQEVAWGEGTYVSRPGCGQGGLHVCAEKAGEPGGFVSGLLWVSVGVVVAHHGESAISKTCIRGTRGAIAIGESPVRARVADRNKSSQECVVSRSIRHLYDARLVARDVISLLREVLAMSRSTLCSRQLVFLWSR